LIFYKCIVLLCFISTAFPLLFFFLRLMAWQKNSEEKGGMASLGDSWVTREK